MNGFDVIIIGAGISGAVLAERYANELDKRVLVIDKREHIGGNCYDFLNEAGVLVPKYGPHFFHTNDDGVWEYMSRFTRWRPYEHRVLSSVDGKLVPVPVNITTVNELFGENIASEEEMQTWLAKHAERITEPKNSEESALSRVGKELYEKLFKPYTKKQWDLWPSELDPLVMNRIPVRTNLDDRYFTDTHQAMPAEGYAKLFERMLAHPNITVRLNTEWDAIKDALPSHEKLFFTGPIDQFFAYDAERLQYRSLRFEHETLDMEQYQTRAQINYPDLAIPYTRITEPKHATGQTHQKTTIIREFSTWDGEPYYPVPTKRNQDLYAAYQRRAKALEKDGIYFVGRLANYKYFNMDQAFRNALDLFERVYDTGLTPHHG
jgi:UDP-galactopyranose mutase